MSHNALLIFTARGPAQILREGGAQAWPVNQARARRHEYAVLTQNTRRRGESWCETTEPHRMGFMIGRISDVIPATEPRGDDDGEKARYLILFDQYALIESPELWPKQRYPFRYTTLEGLDIDIASLDFHPMPLA